MTGTVAKVSAHSTRGVEAHEVLAELVLRLSQVDELELLHVLVPPSMERRPGATPQLDEHAREARTLQPPGDSFTETFIAVAERHGNLASALDVVGFHQPLSEATSVVRVPRQRASADVLAQFAADAGDDQIAVVTSRVRTGVEFAHIPMLDFKLPASDKNLSVVRLIAARLGGGYVLDSGSSYHLYGHQLLSPEQLREWLLRAQLLSRCVDTRWVTHQLLEGRAALRFGHGGSRGGTPTLAMHVS